MIERGEKVALLGPNGAGKTTLAETIVGLRTLAEGVAYLGHNVRLAYFSSRAGARRRAPPRSNGALPLTGHDEQVARGLLGRFLFSADEVHKPVAQLSGGERSRLRLLTLLTGDANFLVLDEPTNHLDVDSVEALAGGPRRLHRHGAAHHPRPPPDRQRGGRVLEISDAALVNHLSVERYWESRAARREADGTGPRAGRGKRARGSAGAPATPIPRRRAATPSGRRRRRAGARRRGRHPAQPRSGSARSTSELAEPQTYQDRAAVAALADERERHRGSPRRALRPMGGARSRSSRSGVPKRAWSPAEEW